MKTTLKYGAVLIGVYLLVSHGTNGGKLMKNAAAGGSQVIKTLQGRG
jgi:hypothetical protein